jgi:hypothetical protein
VAADPFYEAIDEENNRDSPLGFQAAQYFALNGRDGLEPFFRHYAVVWKKSSLKIVTAALLLDEFYGDHLDMILQGSVWTGTLSPAIFALPWVLVGFISTFLLPWITTYRQNN